MIHTVKHGTAFNRFQQLFRNRLLHLSINVDATQGRIRVIAITDHERYYTQKVYDSSGPAASADNIMIELFGAAWWLCSIPVEFAK